MVFSNRVRRMAVASLTGVTMMFGSSMVLANPDGPDQPVEETQAVDMVGNGTQATIDVVSDAVNNVVAVYLSSFLSNGPDILGRSYPLGESPSAEATLQTLCSDCGRRGAVAIGRADGQFALVWVGDDGSGGNVLYAQFYDSQLAAVGNRITIDSDSGRSVKADMNNSGKFAVLRFSGSSSTGEPVVQVFDANGEPVAVAQQVNVFGDVAIAESGAFATAYMEDRSSGDAIVLERFAADGTSLGTTDVATADFFDSSPKIEIAGDGTILVLWGASDNFRAVVGRLFSENGEAQGDQFTVFTALQTSFEVAANVDEFIVGLEGDDDMFVRRLASDGTLADSVLVYSRDDLTNPDPDLVRVSSDADGDLASLVTEDGDDDNGSVFLRRYAGGEDVDIAAALTAGESTVSSAGAASFEIIIDNNHDVVAPVDTQFIGAAILNRSIGAATGLRFGIEYTAGLSDVAIGDIVTPDDERSVACENTEPRVVVCVLDGPLYPGESISARVTGTVSAQDAAGEVSVYATANQFDANELTENDNNTDSIALSGGDADDGGSDSGGGDDDDGSGGGGCTMAASDTPFDPLFVLVLIFAASVIARRRSTRERRDV